MTLLVLALVLFAAVHILPAIPRAKAAAKTALGKTYGPVYGIATLVLFGFAIWAFRQAEAGYLYAPPEWGSHANFLFTLIAFILVGIFLARGTWRNRLRYPMGLAVLFWAAGHLMANGEARSVVFILGIAAAGLLHVFFASRLNSFQPSPERQGHNFLSVLFGIALYGLMVQLHGAIVGVPVIDISGFKQ